MISFGLHAIGWISMFLSGFGSISTVIFRAQKFGWCKNGKFWRFFSNSLEFGQVASQFPFQECRFQFPLQECRFQFAFQECQSSFRFKNVGPSFCSKNVSSVSVRKMSVPVVDPSSCSTDVGPNCNPKMSEKSN